MDVKSAPQEGWTKSQHRAVRPSTDHKRPRTYLTSPLSLPEQEEA
jgi:hypothetical protein